MATRRLTSLTFYPSPVVLEGIERLQKGQRSRYINSCLEKAIKQMPPRRGFNEIEWIERTQIIDKLLENVAYQHVLDTLPVKGVDYE